MRQRKEYNFSDLIFFICSQNPVSLFLHPTTTHGIWLHKHQDLIRFVRTKAIKTMTTGCYKLNFCFHFFLCNCDAKSRFSFIVQKIISPRYRYVYCSLQHIISTKCQKKPCEVQQELLRILESGLRAHGAEVNKYYDLASHDLFVIYSLCSLFFLIIVMHF